MLYDLRYIFLNQGVLGSLSQTLFSQPRGAPASLAVPAGLTTSIREMFSDLQLGHLRLRFWSIVSVAFFGFPSLLHIGQP